MLSPVPCVLAWPKTVQRHPSHPANTSRHLDPRAKPPSSPSRRPPRNERPARSGTKPDNKPIGILRWPIKPGKGILAAPFWKSTPWQPRGQNQWRQTGDDHREPSPSTGHSRVFPAQDFSGTGFRRRGPLQLCPSHGHRYIASKA